MNYTRLFAPQKWILTGIWVIFIVGSLFHFLYNFSGQNFIVGLFAPVNESVWEHLKLALIPIILWWTLYFVIEGKKYNINANKWFTSALVALMTTLFLIPMLFYFYTEAFGIESLLIDITLFFIAVLMGQLMGFHFYKYYEGINSYIAIAILIFIVFIFVVLTLRTPKLPIFKDNITGQYGNISDKH
jgi:hypothetical protein